VINVNDTRVATAGALIIHAPTPKHSFLLAAMVIFRAARATNFNSLWPSPVGPAAVLLVHAQMHAENIVPGLRNGEDE
jgi:hypothetical protein